MASFCFSYIFTEYVDSAAIPHDFSKTVASRIFINGMGFTQTGCNVLLVLLANHSIKPRQVLGA